MLVFFPAMCLNSIKRLMSDLYSVVEQLESDNRDKGAKVAEYNNDPELVGDKVPMVKSIANKEYFATTETSL